MERWLTRMTVSKYDSIVEFYTLKIFLKRCNQLFLMTVYKDTVFIVTHGKTKDEILRYSSRVENIETHKPLLETICPSSV